MDFLYKNEKYRDSGKNRIVIIVLVIIFLSVGALSAYPHVSFAASDELFIGGGNCHPGDMWEDLVAKGFCLTFPPVERQILDDTVIRELRGYSISVSENAAEARKSFLERRQSVIEGSGGIGGAGWEKIEPEDVPIGDAGFVETTKLPHGGYIGSHWEDTDNAEEGYYDQYTFDPIFLQGRCVVSWVYPEIVTHNELYEKNNYEEYVGRDKDDHPRFKLIHAHPASAYSLREETKAILVKDLQDLARRLAPVCGGAVTIPASTPPAGNLPEVEALAEKRPTETDLVPASQPEESNSQYSYDWGEAIIERLTGGADLLLPGMDPNADGSWKEVKVGDVIPRGGKLFTSYASEATLQFAGGSVIVVLALSEIEIDKPEDYVRKTGRIELGTGDVRFKVNQGDFRTDMNVSTPNATASPTGTHFAASYNKNTGLTVYEIYDGSLLITSTVTGQQKTISSSYGQPIKRIEVVKDGTMTDQIAIPKDEWQAQKAEIVPQVQPERRGNGAFWILLILALSGGTIFLHKKGKLKLIIQRILVLIWRNNSKPL